MAKLVILKKDGYIIAETVKAAIDGHEYSTPEDYQEITVTSGLQQWIIDNWDKQDFYAKNEIVYSIKKGKKIEYGRFWICQ